MNTTEPELTFIDERQSIKVEYEQRKMLGGLISWWVKKREDVIGKDLIIETKEHYDRIFLNGKDLIN
jgi:hypothetical protein